MATFNSRLVRCPLCTNVYQDPRTLPCSDTFCKTCLQDYINKTSDSSDSFPCPECRKQTDVSKLKQIRAQWAETFSINNLIVSVLQRFSFRRFSEEIQQTVKCIPCSLDGKQSDAFSFCVTCAEYLCQQCCDIHGKFKETRDHFVLKNNQLPKDRSVYERIEEMCHCKAHPDRQFDYRCYEQACNTFLCSICATMDHRQHNIIRIDKMDNTCRRRYLQIENQDTLALKSKVQNTLDNIVSDADALQNDATKIKYSTCLLIEKLESSITRVKNDVTLELCRQIEKKFSMRSASIPDYVDLINKLSMLKETTETVVKHGTEQQVLICIDEVKNEKALLRKRMPRQNETLDDIVLNRQNLRSKIEHLNTIFDILLDISCKLFETLEINEEAEILSDYERVLTVYKNGENSHGDNSFCKVIFHGTPSLDGSILVTPVLKKEYKHTSVGTDTVSKKDVCVGTETLRKKDVSLETSSAIQRDKSTATDRQWWKNDKSVQAGKSCIRIEHIERSYDSNILLKPVKTTSISATSQTDGYDPMKRTTSMGIVGSAASQNFATRSRTSISSSTGADTQIKTTTSVRTGLTFTQSLIADIVALVNNTKADRYQKTAEPLKSVDSDDPVDIFTRASAQSQVISSQPQTLSTLNVSRSIRNTSTSPQAQSVCADTVLNATKSVRTMMASAQSQSSGIDSMITHTRSQNNGSFKTTFDSITSVPSQSVASDSVLNRRKPNETIIKSAPSRRVDNHALVHNTKPIGTTKRDPACCAVV